MRRFTQQAGDTLVEVLLAIAVLSTVLSGAYVASTRSLRVTRQSQERGEAIKLVETQLEKLRAFSGPLPAGDICFNAANLPILAPCIENLGGGGVDYSLTIHPELSLPGNYRVGAVWDGIQGTDEGVEVWYIK